MVDITRSMEKSPEGFQALSWVLYIASAVVLASHWIDITGVSMLVGSVIILIITGLRKQEASGTIYNSHLQNIFTVVLAYLIVSGILFTITVGTFGFGIIITWPLALLMLAWCAYRLLKGFIRLNDGIAFI